MGNTNAKRQFYLVERKPAHTIQPRDIHYLVFSGGSIRGLALMSSYATLLSMYPQLDIRGCAGVSAGAIMCLAVCLRLSPREMMMFPNQEFLEKFSTGFKVQKKCQRWSVLDIEPLREALAAQMEKKSLSRWTTFSDISWLDMRVFAVDITNNKLVEFSSRNTPNHSVLDAVVASCAMPFVFPPVQTPLGCFMDGAVVQQFPFREFPLRETLGIYLYDRYRSSIGNDIFHSLSDQEKDHIITVDVSKLTTLQLNPGPRLLAWIMSQGQDAVRNYFQKR
jgi:predicted acylesterase/phospholipase RssA